MKALQFDRFGSPDVIVLRDVPQPEPGPGRIRIAVRACGLTPADWHVVDGLLADRLPPLPRGLGLEIAGTVDALGEGVTGVRTGDRVFGPATFDGPTAGAAEYALIAGLGTYPRRRDRRAGRRAADGGRDGVARARRPRRPAG